MTTSAIEKAGQDIAWPMSQLSANLWTWCQGLVVRAQAWGICMHGEVVLPVDEVIISGLFAV